jgi:hypothetical protein
MREDRLKALGVRGKLRKPLVRLTLDLSGHSETRQAAPVGAAVEVDK